MVQNSKQRDHSAKKKHNKNIKNAFCMFPHLQSLPTEMEHSGGNMLQLEGIWHLYFHQHVQSAAANTWEHQFCDEAETS